MASILARFISLIGILVESSIMDVTIVRIGKKGRIVIMKEICKTLKISGDSIPKIYIDRNRIVLEP